MNTARPSRELKAKAKQYEIARFSFMWCQLYLVAYIELMTPPKSETEDIWRSMKSREFPDADVNFLKTFGRSLVSSIVTSYTQPWSGNQRSRSRKVKLPKEILRDLAKVRRRDDARRRLLPFDLAIHKRMLTARDKVVAHSDFSQWGFTVDHPEPSTIETKLRDPFHYLSLDDAKQLIENTKSLRSQFAIYLQEIREKLQKSIKARGKRSAGGAAI